MREAGQPASFLCAACYIVEVKESATSFKNRRSKNIAAALGSFLYE